MRFLRQLWHQPEPEPIQDISQSGEGAVISRLVSQHHCEPFLVDVGAHDGLSISNSFSLIRSGWKAILIEPVPAVFSKLQKLHENRPNVTCLQIACSNASGDADLYLGSDGEYGFFSTLCRDENEWFSKARSERCIRVKTDTLTNILSRENAPNPFGLLLIDTEGLDYEVLDGLDFSSFRPTIVVTEEYEWNPQKHAAKYSLLINKGFSLVQKIGCNTIWLDRAGAAERSDLHEADR